MIKRYITVPFQIEGMHHYPGADTNPELATGGWDDVSHLGHEHFHYFFFKVTIQVFDDNRELEFIQFSRLCKRLYAQGVLQMNNKSCEMLAEDLINVLIHTYNYKNREITVEVYEDNINGSIVKYNP
jgi:hypothetical protein